MTFSHELIAGQRMEHQNCVRLLRIEVAVSLIGDGHAIQDLTAVQGHGARPRQIQEVTGQLAIGRAIVTSLGGVHWLSFLSLWIGD